MKTIKSLSKRVMIILFVLLLNSAGMKNVYAHDFEAICPSGQTLYYNITDATNHHVEITYPDDSYYNWYSYPTPIGDLTIPNSVTSNGITYSVISIGNHAFYYCQYLSSITIPNSVISIDDYAFYYCSGLTGNLFIPNSVTSIGTGAFSKCSELTGMITIPNSVSFIGTNPFSGCSGLEQIVVESGNTVYDSRNNCNAIIKTSTNTLISGCKNTTIPSSVTSIGNSAFSGCSGFTSIDIPNTITSIGEKAFAYCSNATGTLTIPNTITYIGTNPFSGCSEIEQIVVESGNTVYDSRNNCNAIIKTSTNTLISGCKNSVIPNTVTSIGQSAFSYLSNLTSISIPNSVTSIGGFAFDNCVNLTSIIIPNSVTTIGTFVFQSCWHLNSVTIGNSMTYIGNYAFHNCYNLTMMTVLSETPPSLGYDSFSTVPRTIPIFVPIGTIEAYQNAPGWNEFTNYIEDNVGIIEQNNISVSIYPTLTHNNLFIKTSEPINTIEIFTMTGSLILRQPCWSDNMEIDIQNLSPGMYVLRIDTGYAVETRRFVKE